MSHKPRIPLNWEIFRVFADYGDLKSLHPKIKRQKASVFSFSADTVDGKLYTATIRLRDKGGITKYTGQHKSFGMVILEVLAILESVYRYDE